MVKRLRGELTKDEDRLIDMDERVRARVEGSNGSMVNQDQVRSIDTDERMKTGVKRKTHQSNGQNMSHRRACAGAKRSNG